MSVGMYDMDMATYTLVPFNLELMKLSAYYKKKREVVILSPFYSRAASEIHFEKRFRRW